MFLKDSKNWYGDSYSSKLVHSIQHNSSTCPLNTIQSETEWHLEQRRHVRKCTKRYQISFCSRLLSKPFWFSDLPASFTLELSVEFFWWNNWTVILVVLNDVVKEAPKECTALTYKTARESPVSWEKTAGYSLHFIKLFFIIIVYYISKPCCDQ